MSIDPLILRLKSLHRQLQATDLSSLRTKLDESLQNHYEQQQQQVSTQFPIVKTREMAVKIKEESTFLLSLYI